MLTSVTRDQYSRPSCAEVSFFSSQARFVYVHGLQPKRVVLQRYRSHPLTSRCCSILSATRTATRCNSTCHQIDAYPVQLRHAVHRPSGPNDHHRAPRARIHLDPPGSTFRPVVSTTWHSPPCSPSRLSGLHRPSRLRPSRPLVHRSLPRVINTFRLSFRSLTLLSVLTFFSENRQLARLLASRAISRPGAALALKRYGCACPGSPCCP